RRAQPCQIPAVHRRRAYLRDVPAQLRLLAFGIPEECNVIRTAFFILLLALAQAAGAQTKIKMTLDWRFEGQTSFMWLGLARGYFQQEGLDVQVDAGSGSTAAIQRIDPRASDLALGSHS